MWTKKRNYESFFLICTSYDNLPSEISWEQVKGNNTERQFEIARKVKSRPLKRKKIIENFEAGHPQHHPGSRAPGSCWAVQCILSFVLYF